MDIPRVHNVHTMNHMGTTCVNFPKGEYGREFSKMCRRDGYELRQYLFVRDLDTYYTNLYYNPGRLKIDRGVGGKTL